MKPWCVLRIARETTATTFRSRVDNRTYMAHLQDVDEQTASEALSTLEMTGSFGRDISVVLVDDELSAKQLAGTLLRLYPENAYLVAQSRWVMFRDYLPERTAEFTNEGLLPL